MTQTLNIRVQEFRNEGNAELKKIQNQISFTKSFSEAHCMGLYAASASQSIIIMSFEIVDAQDQPACKVHT